MVNYITLRFPQAMIQDESSSLAECFYLLTEEGPIDLVAADWSNDTTLELATTTTSDPGDWISLTYTRPVELTHALRTATGVYYGNFSLANE